MNRQKRNKLNQLMKSKTSGVVITNAQLKEQGISRQLVNSYKKSGWLEPIGKGAYVLVGSKVDWSSGMMAIHTGGIHVGGKSALHILGYSHFLPMNQTNLIYVFGETGAKLPIWFQTYQWGSPINYITTSFLPSDLGLMKKDYNNHTITISSAERAILEVLYLVPKLGTLEEADLLIEGLTTLRPSLLQSLLENCNSIKVKRLFLFLAERHHFSWLKRLKIDKINLGKGKRVIVKGGHLDPNYQITVPKSLINHDSERS